MVLDAEATACGGGFADKKNDLCAGNARDAGDLPTCHICHNDAGNPAIRGGQNSNEDMTVGVLS